MQIGVLSGASVIDLYLLLLSCHDSNAIFEILNISKQLLMHLACLDFR